MASTGSGIRIVVYDEHNKILPAIRDAMLESVYPFNYLGACASFIQQNGNDDRAIVVVTTSLDLEALQAFESLVPVEAILILSATRRTIDTFPSKVVGVYAQIEDLFQALFQTVDDLEMQLNANSVLFHRLKDGTDNTNFYFYHIWFHYKMNQTVTKKILVEQAHILFRSERKVKGAARDFLTSYKQSEVLQWLDKYQHPFPYHLLVTNALRTHDQQILFLVRFFIFDISRHMKPLPIGPSYNRVFFGTKLPVVIVDRLEQQSSRDVIAFQCFLPVTRSRSDALLAATKPSRRRKLANVLFKIDASHALCASANGSLLIDMATPFLIERVTRNTGFGGVQQLVTIVTLVSLDKRTREDLIGDFIKRQKAAGKTISDFINHTIHLVRADNSYLDHESNSDITSNSIPLYVLSVSDTDNDSSSVSNREAEADELIKRGMWAQAVDELARVKNPNVRVLNKQGCLLRERLQDLPSALECHEQALGISSERGRAETLIYIGIVRHEMKEYDKAITCYTEALQLSEKHRAKNPAVVARCLVGLGNAYWGREELDKALEFTQRALFIREQEVKPRNDFDVAACLGNLGSILHDRGDIEEALIYAKRAVDMLSDCGPRDLRYAAALNNLGAMYQSCGIYDKAREYFQRALTALPDDNHPYRTSALNNIARLDEIEKARKQ